MHHPHQYLKRCQQKMYKWLYIQRNRVRHNSPDKNDKKSYHPKIRNSSITSGVKTSRKSENRTKNANTAKRQAQQEKKIKTGFYRLKMVCRTAWGWVNRN